MRGSAKAPISSSATLPATAAIAVMKRPPVACARQAATMRRATGPRGAATAPAGDDRSRRSSGSSATSSSSRPRKRRQARSTHSAAAPLSPSAKTMQSIGPCWKCQRPSPSCARTAPLIAGLRDRRASGQGLPAGASTARHAPEASTLLEPLHPADVAAEGAVVVEAHRELDRRDDRRRRHRAEARGRHLRHVDHHRDAAARPDVDRRAAAGDVDQQALDRAREPHRVVGDAGAQAPAGAGDVEHRAERWLAVLADPLDHAPHFRRHLGRPRHELRRRARTRPSPRRWSRPSACAGRAARRASHPSLRRWRAGR